MSVTTATMQANVLHILTMDSTDTVLLARALEWLNEAVEDVAMYLPEAEFFQTSEMPLTLVVDQATYAMPSDFFQLIQVRNDDESVILNMLPRAEFDRRHPDPSSETTDTPADGTLEFDRENGRNILRVAPIPASADTFYAIVRRWHKTLSSTQGLQWDKIQRTVERRGAYYGSLEVRNFTEDAPFRAELAQVSLAKMQALQQIVTIMKPRPVRIPTVMRKGDY
ncbi:MAG: hypothetical protein ABIE47_08095 [Pseudomonadota bacterium]